jgi:hypothetical protein
MQVTRTMKATKMPGFTNAERADTVHRSSVDPREECESCDSARLLLLSNVKTLAPQRKKWTRLLRCLICPMFAVRLWITTSLYPWPIGSLRPPAWYSLRPALRTFTARRDQLMICGQYEFTCSFRDGNSRVSLRGYHPTSASGSETTLPTCIWNGASQCERSRRSDDACAGRQDAMCSMSRKCCVSYMITHSSRSLQTTTVSECRIAFSDWKVLCIHVRRAARRLQPGDTHPRLQLSPGCYTRLWIPINFCTLCYKPAMWRVLEVVYTILSTCIYGQWRTFVLLIGPHYNTDSVSKFGSEF